ncbi:MAG: MFS transporter [Rubellimicrobium sp.]|nr:MFS transporter [Rubellimicrobium sp.]
MTFARFVIDNRAWLFAGFVVAFTSSYGQTYFISLFAGEIMREFRLTDGQWGTVYTIGTTASAVVMIWAGALTDRFRARGLGAAVLLGLALSCLGMALMPGSWGWALIGVIFALRLFGQGMTSHVALVAMARWFAASRGRAISIASMGFALGQAVLPVVFVAALGWVDWRMRWVLAAGLVVIVIPIILSLLTHERTPQSIAEKDQVSGMNGRNWTRSEALRHPLFWLMVPALLCPPAWGTALFFQQVHLSEVKGWSLAEFVALMPLFTIVLISATFASGWAIDKLGTGRLVPVYMLPFALGFVVLAQTETIPGAAVGLVLVALGSGLQATLPGVFFAEYYGSRHLGAIRATAGSVMIFGSAIGPGVSGWLIDAGIMFPDQMMGIALLFVLAGLSATLGVVRARSALTAAAQVDI